MRRLLRSAVLGLGLALTALAAGAAPAATAQDMSLGNPKAKVHIIEYASLSCPHCAHFNATVYPQLKAKYLDTGKVRYTLKEMLTPPAEVAAAGWLLARCAGPERYFTVVDQVFRSQSKWETGKVGAVFEGIAKANGLDKAKMTACLSNQAAADALNARTQAAFEKDGVDSTPTFFVNGKRVEGELTLKTFDAAIAAAAKK